MSKTALVIIADGTEEMEAVIPIDVLRRAKVEVTVAGLCGTEPVTCSRNVRIVPDCDIGTAISKGPYDAVIIPGGLQGATAMAKAETVKEILADQDKAKRVIGAICAGPLALKSHGIGVGGEVTSYPALKDKMEGYQYSEARVVCDNHIITSRGPATSLEFALSLVEAVCGRGVRKEVEGPMLV